MKTLKVDVTKCIGCHNCQLACKDEHVGNDWSPIAGPQSEGQFWIRVDEHERGKLPRVRLDCVAIMCQHCAAAPCMAACPQKAIYRRDDNIVLINGDKCNGCKDCIAACPYEVINFNEELKVAQKCTMCAHLLDRGWKEPRCVTACPTETLTFVDWEQIEALGGRKEFLRPEANTKPRVAYMGLPKPFAVGEVYSPAEDACLEGVVVTMTHLTTGDVQTVRTNNYGDFKVNGLKPGTYALSVEKDGYYPKQISSLEVEEAADMGEIKLYRKRA